MLPSCAWSTPLQRTFTSFPSGWAGAALLLLRVAVGACAIVESALTVIGAHSTLHFAAASVAALAGLALVIGFMTPIASALVAVEGAAILASVHSTVLKLFDSRMALVEFVVMAAVLAILGPGASSMDARLFGRREVAISEDRRPGDL